MDVAELVFSPAAEFSLTALAKIFSRAFEGYPVALPSDPVSLAARLRQEQIDLAASLVLVGPDGQGQGIAFIARRGEIARLAAMAIAPTWRGRGIGSTVMTRLLDDAAARGDRRMVLEVIEQNPAGVALYRKHGFTVQQRLVGYECAVLAGTETGELAEASISQVADAVAKYGDDGLPWQLAAATLAAVTPPYLAFRLGPAFALVNINAEAVTFRAIVVPTAHRRQGLGRRLVRGLAARYPDRKWVVPALVPERMAAGFFLSSGFSLSALSQFDMIHDLQARSI